MLLKHHTQVRPNRVNYKKTFKAFYSQYDKRSGKDFEKTFPIIGEWYRGI